MLHGYTSRGYQYSGLLEKCPAISFHDRTVTTGDGQVSFSTETQSNNTTENSRTYAAGLMQISEVVALGGGEYDGC